MDKILIRRLTLPVHIGITPEEQRNPQAIVIDLELLTDIRYAASSDDLTHTIDYATVCQQLTDYVATTCFKLVETLAEKIADFLLKKFPIQALQLTLEKKPFDLPQIDSVAIVISRYVNATADEKLIQPLMH